MKGQDCSELFVSEVLFGESSLTLSGPNDNLAPITNYALEIYNPTQDSIYLSSYKIELFTLDSVETEIDLSGIILPETAMVLSTPSADSLIRSKADLLSSNLTFGNHVMVQIVKEGAGVIDVVGKLGLEEEIGTFTLDTLINNPSILQAAEFDLRFLKGLNVRRAASVLEGKTSFITSELLHDWTIYPNAFVEDLGDHRCACKSGTGVVNWQGIDFFGPEVVTAENDVEDCINSTYDAEYLNALISVTPTIVTNRASLVVEENSLSIQGIRVFSANGQLLKQIPVDGISGGTIDLDLSYLPARGYYLIAIQTNKGLITKRIIKQ